MQVVGTYIFAYTLFASLQILQQPVMERKSMLVFVSSPNAPQLVPTIMFARLLMNHHNDLTISFFIIPPYGSSSNRHCITSFISSLSAVHGLHFLTPTLKSKCLPPITPACEDSLIETSMPIVERQVSRLIEQPNSPKLVGFVVDELCTSMIAVASKFKVPSYVFFSHSAAFLDFQLFSLSIEELWKKGPTKLTLSDSRFSYNVSSFNCPVPAGAFPCLPMDNESRQVFLNRTLRMKNAESFLVNTFLDLEPYIPRSLSNNSVYTVGPVPLILKDEFKKFKEGPELKWLDAQPPSSVIFFCLEDWDWFKHRDQLMAIKGALEKSEVQFLWALQKPLPKSALRSNPKMVKLMQNFFRQKGERGLVTRWAHQAQMLAHKAVGGFVSNCGWNSIMESLHHGVPIATWPLEDDQHLNAFLLVRELKLGVEISLDYGREIETSVISQQRIVKAIREVMNKDSEVSKKVKEMSVMSKRALAEGGSSYAELERFIKERLNID